MRKEKESKMEAAMQESDKESSKYSYPSASVEDWFQDPPQIPESMDAQVLR